MSFPRIVRRFVLAIAVLVAFLGAFQATATETGPQVQVLEAYTAATKPKQKNADAYARFVNVETTDRLVGADSPACDRVELVAADGTKRPYEDFHFQEDVEIGFRENAPHLRLVGLKAPLVRGQSVAVTLHFEATGPFSLNVIVQ
jgi:copper(I)-binding protein